MTIRLHTLFLLTGLQPTDVQVVELHDCFSTNELITYEGLGLCDTGKKVSLFRLYETGKLLIHADRIQPLLTIVLSWTSFRKNVSHCPNRKCGGSTLPNMAVLGR